MNDLAELDSHFSGGAAIAPRTPAGQATQVEQARAIAEVRAAVLIAMERPRDRTAAIAEMREVCSIPALAERAFFRVPRGGEHVNGESIHLARELARCRALADAVDAGRVALFDKDKLREQAHDGGCARVE